MAEINKLSVGQALDKLRGTDAPSSEMQRLDEKIGAHDEEIQRLRAANRRLERSQRSGSTVVEAPKANSGRVAKPIALGVVLALVFAVLVWLA